MFKPRFLKHMAISTAFSLALMGTTTAMAPQTAHADGLFSKPLVKQAAIGAAVGAGSGVLSDRVSVGKGTLVGGLVGAGTGYMSTNDTLQRKPLLRQTLKGAAIGTGIGYATDSGSLKGAAIGAGAGAGYHYVKKYVFDN